MNQNEMIAGYVGTDPVEKIYLGSELIWQNEVDYSKMYFTLEILSGATNYMFDVGYPGTGGTDDYLEWRKDGGEWHQGIYYNYTFRLPLEPGIYEFRNGIGHTYPTHGISIGSGTGPYKAYGNIMSLYDKDNFATMTAFPADVNKTGISNLFDNTGIIDASNLIIPATTIPSGMCSNMFSNCASLTGAPNLPATVVESSGYGFGGLGDGMFAGCTSLTTAPQIAAMIVGKGGMYGMFRGCTSLTTAPELPATTLAEECYASMFSGCTSLTTAQSILPATTLARNCYRDMFYGCTSLTEGPVIAGTGPKTSGSMPCMDMFNSCTALTAVTFLFPFNYSTDAWQFYFGYWRGTGTTLPASGVFNKAPGADWGQPGEYYGEGVPAGWTIVDYTPPA